MRHSIYRSEFRLYFNTVILETVHEPQLKEVLFMQSINTLFSCRIIDLSGADVAVENSVGESELVLIAHARKPVTRYFLNKN